ncbi:hypothetical protein KC19_1G267000 [Ceratodon purpureus]|uniref:Seipin n=1 Tax=Ceratodon purpureus TaxID=3225 RepID=A0A8T0JC75_CERPU|nr:hypothetical protein KC19_1G267000 [Ceratodon purpureus]
MDSAPVHPLVFDDDHGGGHGHGRIGSPTADHVLLASSGSGSHVWPGVDSDEEGGKQGDGDGSNVTDGDGNGDGGRITYPKVYDGGVGEEVLEFVEGGNGDGEIEEEEEEGVKKGSLVDDQVLQELGDVLSAEETELLRGRLAEVEGESSSGSVVNSSGRDARGVYVTEELPDDWLGVEEVSSSGVEVGVGEVSQGSDGGEANSSDTGSRKVYTFPKSVDEVLKGPIPVPVPAVEEAGSQILASPVGIAIELVGFQVKLIVQMFSFALWFMSFGVSMMSFPFRASLTATNVAVSTAVDGYALATQVRPMVEQGVAQARPVLRQTAKRCGFGCVAAVYVMFMLGALLVPALFLNIWFARGFIEEPVEFREILHFDYRQEHPSATVSLLPPTILAKVKGGIYPNKVLYARAIPPSHKLQVTVFLTLPESHYNRDLGNFQVSAELLSVRGQYLKRASWPCMLRFQSSSIRYAKQVMLGVPLLMGLSGESQTISLRLFENEEETKIPTAMVRFLLEPKAGYPIGQGLPQIYSAEAQVLSVLPWRKDILRRWKWTFYVWSFLSVFMFEVMVVLCCCHRVLLPSSLLQGITEGYGESQPTAIVKEATAKRVGKHGRRVNFSDELPTARPVRVPSQSDDKEKEREFLLGSAESSSTITGPRLRRLPTPAVIHTDMDSSEATSSWSIPPPLEPLDYVGGKLEAAGGSARRLGKTVVDGAAEGMSEAISKVAPVLDPKALKSD